ncbi:MAG: hypothetical protein ABL921_17530, partial [Pirellula sp.]
MYYRLACLAVGVRLHQDTCHHLPVSLEKLRLVNVDISNLKPIGDKPFGFKNQSASDLVGCTLWG